MKRVGPKEAKELLDQGWVYLDVRSEAEFAQAHPSGAYNVPLMHAGSGPMRPNPDFLRVVESVWPKDAKLVVGCLSGGRSIRAAQLLEQAGYVSIAEQRCGMGGARDEQGRLEPGWAAEGLPVESGEPAGRAYKDLLEKAR